jgi:hypothetical protein
MITAVIFIIFEKWKNEEAKCCGVRLGLGILPKGSSAIGYIGHDYKNDPTGKTTTAIFTNIHLSNEQRIYFDKCVKYAGMILVGDPNVEEQIALKRDIL